MTDTCQDQSGEGTWKELSPPQGTEEEVQAPAGPCACQDPSSTLLLLLVFYACSLPCLHVQGCKPIFFLNKSLFADEIPSQRFVYSWHGCGAFWYTYIAHGACLFNCSTTNGCSGCFPFGAIKNKASLILNVVWLTYTHVFLAYIPRSGIVVS